MQVKIDVGLGGIVVTLLARLLAGTEQATLRWVGGAMAVAAANPWGGGPALRQVYRRLSMQSVTHLLVARGPWLLLLR